MVIAVSCQQSAFADENIKAAESNAKSPAVSASRSKKPTAFKGKGQGSSEGESVADGDNKSASDKKDAAPPEPKVVRRDAVSGDAEADQDELKATVGKDGRVAFEFRNQPWIDLVQWLAEISNQPLDWLELPGDRVNLRSPGRYTVKETRDLFNRYLLARGYTLLEIDGGLTIAKTESINPAIVPRVEPSALVRLPMHSFVRTSLDVGWLSAEKLSEELKPMISSNGRLTAMSTTNRIEAMDAAVNLRQVAELLEQERNNASREALAPEFKLRHLAADEAKRMLEEFLGIKQEESGPLTPQQIQMMQQMRNQNQAEKPPEKKIDISIVANPRQNSVIIRAPVDRVAVAMEFLRRIDVPSKAMLSLTDVKARVQVFRLASLDPEKLIEIVSEMNVLEPTTRVRVDKDNNALIVSGSAADRYIINSLIERLDGSGRRFEVLPLRRLDAAEVAESIAFLMGQKDDDNKQNNRRSYYYGYYSRNDEKEKEKDEFRVSANVRYRQVLLWANEQEMSEVRSLLIKLGELPPLGGNSQTVRILDASATPETYEYLQRLRQQWNRLSPNPLELPDANRFQEPNEIPTGNGEAIDSDGSDDAEGTLPKSSDPLKDDGSVAEFSQASVHQLTMLQLPIDKQESEIDSAKIRSSRDFDRAFGGSPPEADVGRVERRKPAATIRIELDSSGNLVLVSPDTAALDQLENLMLQMTPPKRPYRVFHIKHASAMWMKLNLEDYFADLDQKEQSDSNSFYRWYWGSSDGNKNNQPSGLGKESTLRFVDDLDTNTLVVSGASTEQLRTIAELIELWDVPEPVNKRKTRFTRLVQIEFGKAEKISETVKEAYRDLLSSNDKTFTTGGSGGQQGVDGKKVAKSRDGEGSGLQSSESGRDAGGADFSFKGKLSLGVDSIGNTILVSAEGEPLLELVTDMIGQLDDAARPQGEIQVVELPGRINSDMLQNALQALGAQPVTVSSKSESTKKKRSENNDES